MGQAIVRPDKVVIANNGATFFGNVVKNIPGGVLIGPHKKPISAIINMPKVPRYTHDRKLVEDWIAEEFNEGEQLA